MEDFNSKYSGEQVEALLDQVASGNAGGGGGGGITVETDPIFSASPAAGITEEQIVAWDDLDEMVNLLDADVAQLTKDVMVVQESLTDLDTIRSGASKGATALQSVPEEYVTEDQLIWTKVEGEAGVRLKGTNGTATGNFAISAGDDKTASDGTPFPSVASGDHAVAFGYGNTCSGRTTLAQGLYNIVTAKDSVAFGQRNTVNGDQAFAAGQQNEVSARIGVAIGYKNKATNTDSIAIGYQNTSSGSASVAMGDTCEASGTSSTAMGYKTKATGASSSTFGQNTQATNEGEVAMGVYNKSTTSTDASEQTSFSFGIGTSDTNRKNALEIKKNGDVYIGDKLLSGGGITEETDPIFSASPAASITEEKIAEWDAKSEQGEQGPKGEDGEDGVGIASVKQTTTSTADGGTNVVTITLSNGTTSTFNVKNGSKGSNGTNGTNGKDGADGEDGATFTPSVDSAGNLSWTNNKGLANPPTVNIKGPKGDAGEGGGSGGGGGVETISLNGGMGVPLVIDEMLAEKRYWLFVDSGLDGSEQSIVILGFEGDGVKDGVHIRHFYAVIDCVSAMGDPFNVSLSLPDGDIYWSTGTPIPIVGDGRYELSITQVIESGFAYYNAVLTSFSL